MATQQHRGLENYYHLFYGSPFFSGISKAQLPSLLEALCVSIQDYQKDEAIFHIGDPFLYVGFVLEGITELSFLDEAANIITMNHFSAGKSFGDSFVLSKTAASPVQMRALTPCKILYLDFNSVLDNRTLPEPERSILLENMLRASAQHNTFLHLKIRILSQKKLRDRILLHIRTLPISDDCRIHLRFTRSEWAEFLGVNRSALSRELSHMHQEGLLLAEDHAIQILNLSIL